MVRFAVYFTDGLRGYMKQYLAMVEIPFIGPNLEYRDIKPRFCSAFCSKIS